MGRRKEIAYEINANGCHICTSHKTNQKGYPKLDRGRPTTVVRYLYEAIHGRQPTEILLRHTCDIRACINLDHIIPGSALDNTRDLIERNPERLSNKLTPEQVRVIRVSPESCTTLSLRYGVGRMTISDVKRRKTWDWL